MSRDDFEYPDRAGYPDGSGFLDEGTALRPEDGGSIGFRAPSADAETEIVVRDDRDASEYQALIGNRMVGLIRYARLDGSPVLLRATFVEPGQRGLGIATALIARVLDDLRDRGEPFAVECPQVRAYLNTHRGYDHLVVSTPAPN
jgi:uncharacterized protein